MIMRYKVVVEKPIINQRFLTSQNICNNTYNMAPSITACCWWIKISIWYNIKLTDIKIKNI